MKRLILVLAMALSGLFVATIRASAADVGPFAGTWLCEDKTTLMIQPDGEAAWFFYYVGPATINADPYQGEWMDLASDGQGQLTGATFGASHPGMNGRTVTIHPSGGTQIVVQMSSFDDVKCHAMPWPSSS